MDQAALVTTDFAIGSEMVEALNRSAFALSIAVAMWLYAGEYEDWRFLLASRRLDAAKPAEAYGLVHDALSAADISIERTPALMIVKMSDPFIRELRRTFSKTKSVEGVRLGNQQIGDRFVEAALVYQIR